MRPPQILASALVLGTVACGPATHFAATNPAPRPLASRPAADVRVYVTAIPDAPFVEVGIIETRETQWGSRQDMPALIAEMRRVAGERGCEGLVLSGPRDRTVSQSSATTSGTETTLTSSTRTLDGFWGTCIVFLEPTAVLAGRHDRR